MKLARPRKGQKAPNIMALFCKNAPPKKPLKI